MAIKMHAAVVEQFGKPLVLWEWEIPAPGAGQILVKTEACGVCHTDLHAAHGDWPVKPRLPFVPGHEGTGLVAAIGAGVTSVKEGDRVGVPWLYSACSVFKQGVAMTRKRGTCVLGCTGAFRPASSAVEMLKKDHGAGQLATFVLQQFRTAYGEYSDCGEQLA